MPLVSVVIPTFNRSALISEAIDSVLKQTYRDFEIIVIDDGSTDGTGDVIRRYGKSVSYVHQENAGAGVARNLGIRMARGKYIAFLDSDDLWFDYKLGLQVEIMEKAPEIGFLSTDFCIMRDSGERIGSALKTWHNEPKPWEEVYETSVRYSAFNPGGISSIQDFTIYRGNIYYHLLLDPYVLPSSSVVRKACLTSDIKFTEGAPVYEDWEFFARLARDHTAAFLDIDTTINRGHKDDVRLTLCSSKTKARSRLDMIRNVWGADDKFLQNYHKKVSEIEGEQLMVLAKQLLLEYRRNDVRKVLKQLTSLDVPRKRYFSFFINSMMYIPGAIHVIHLMRNYMDKCHRG